MREINQKRLGYFEAVYEHLFDTESRRCSQHRAVGDYAADRAARGGTGRHPV